jgi:hypothetical protein
MQNVKVKRQNAALLLFHFAFCILHFAFFIHVPPMRARKP